MTFTTIRALVAYATRNDMLFIRQMDVVTAFLNGQIDEEIHMDQPKSFKERGKERLVRRLHRSLFGLKQSPRCWNCERQEFLTSKAFTQSQEDPYLFYNLNENGHPIVRAICVDDLIIAADRNEDIGQPRKC